MRKRPSSTNFLEFNFQTITKELKNPLSIELIKKQASGVQLSLIFQKDAM